MTVQTPFGVRIAGTGSAVPDRVLTNADLESMVDTSDEWIVKRTGISERRICDPEKGEGAFSARMQGHPRCTGSSGNGRK